MNSEGLIKLHEYIRKDKPKVLREGFALKEPLTFGWLLPYLLGLEDMTWGRWQYWTETKLAGQLLPEPIPQIEWATEHGEGSYGWKMLDRCLNSVTRHGEWRGWSASEHFDYFLDWILFGLGDYSQKELPEERAGCEGASARLYQLFNLEPLLAYPHDYFGDIMAASGFGKHSGFYPTPMEVASMMVQMQMDGEDCRAKSCCDPCIGTGRMILCASNYSMRLYGQDINRSVIKAALVNGYMYAPWLVRPLAFLDDLAPTVKVEDAIPVTATTTSAEIPAVELKPQLELELV